MKHLNEEMPRYIVDILENPDLKLLESRWLDIEKKCELPFFMTWSWISCWISTYNPNLVVTYAYHEEKIVCIGLFTLSKESRRGFIKSNQYRLHQTGTPEYDQIWIEYNDFLCTEEHKMKASNACLNALMNRDQPWNEIIISMMKLSRGNEILAENDLASIISHSPRYSTDLTRLCSEKNYLSSLSSNTRYQIRHSVRLYEKQYGPLKINKAQSISEALEFFLRAGELHKKRWADSGFKNPAFIEFHTNLIQQSYDHGKVDLFEVTSGNKTIAILYYHIAGNIVYFYLQGIHYKTNKKLKPGLVAHSLMTQYYFEQGIQHYDYMGGYSQYKTQLASQNEDLVTVRIQKPGLQFTIEKFGQKIKRLSKSTD